MRAHLIPVFCLLATLTAYGQSQIRPEVLPVPPQQKGEEAPLMVPAQPEALSADADVQIVTDMGDEGEGLATSEEESVPIEVSLPDNESVTDGPGITREALPDLILELPDEDEVVMELPDVDIDAVSNAKDSETVTVDFPDEEVKTIIRNVADLYELNVVIPEALVGRISIKLRNVTWRQVFDVVLEPMGYTYIEDGNIVKVKSLAEIQMEPMDTRVFTIDFAKAEMLKSGLEALIDTNIGGKVLVDTRSNSLIVTERPSRMKSVAEIIERLDRPTDQVMIESKFVEVSNTNSEEIGVKWSSLSGVTLGANDMSRTYTRDYGNGTSYSQTANVDSGSSGWVYDDLGTIVGTTAGNTVSDAVSKTLTDVTNITRLDTAVFSASDFNVVLSALETQNDVELVSNPTVVTLNNMEAQIHVGEEYPMILPRYNPETGSYEAGDMVEKELGVKLKVTPNVNSAGFITLDIEPEVSNQSGTVSQFGADYPVIATRKTKSNVTIKSGYTLAIGGLIENNNVVTENKVPLLGDIPLLGRLFRHNSDSEDARNLIIFITAKILNPDGSTYRDVFSRRRLYDMGIKSRDLPGYQPPEEEELLFSDLQKTRDDIEQLEAEAKLQSQMNQLKADKIKEKERNERQRKRAEKLDDVESGERSDGLRFRWE